MVRRGSPTVMRPVAEAIAYVIDAGGRAGACSPSETSRTIPLQDGIAVGVTVSGSRDAEFPTGTGTAPPH